MCPWTDFSSSFLLIERATAVSLALLHLEVLAAMLSAYPQGWSKLPRPLACCSLGQRIEHKLYWPPHIKQFLQTDSHGAS